jgi:hypothetical protein
MLEAPGLIINGVPRGVVVAVARMPIEFIQSLAQGLALCCLSVYSTRFLLDYFNKFGDLEKTEPCLRTRLLAAPT